MEHWCEDQAEECHAQHTEEHRRTERLAYSSEIGGVNTTMARLAADLRDAEFELAETTVTAPTDGCVTQLFVRHDGRHQEPWRMAGRLPATRCGIVGGARTRDRGETRDRGRVYHMQRPYDHLRCAIENGRFGRPVPARPPATGETGGPPADIGPSSLAAGSPPGGSKLGHAPAISRL